MHRLSPLVALLLALLSAGVVFVAGCTALNRTGEPSGQLLLRETLSISPARAQVRLNETLMEYWSDDATLTYHSEKPTGPTAGSETVDVLEFLARVVSHIPNTYKASLVKRTDFDNTYKASLVKRTDFDNTGSGGPHYIKRLQHRAVLTSISKSVQMSAPNTYRGSSMQERTNRSLRPRNSSVPSYRPTQTPTSSISGMVS